MGKSFGVGVFVALFGLGLSAPGGAGAFEFEELDPGSEVPVLSEPPRSSGRSTLFGGGSLPTIRGGTIGGRPVVQGTYERLGERVYFESRRGPAAHDQSVAADHPNEIDICFRDASGLPLFASFGGDEPLIPDCAPQQASEILSQHPELLTGFNRSYLGMRRAARALEKASFSAAFDQEQRELVHPARNAAKHLRRRRPLETILPAAVDLNAGEAPAEPTPVPSDASSSIGSAAESVGAASSPAVVAGAASSPAAMGAAASRRAVVYWKHMMGVWTGRFLFTPFDHTATIAYTAYSYDRRLSWALFAWASRNHGRHWYEAGMRHKCSYHSGFDRGPSIWRQSCNTTYNPLSTWGHNCNDDAILQIYSVKYNRPFNNTSGVPCNDFGTNLFTPSCLPNG